MVSVRTTVQTTRRKVTQRIKEVQILLKAYTENEIPLADVNIANLAISAPAAGESRTF
jgi:hypothetical protein